MLSVYVASDDPAAIQEFERLVPDVPGNRVRVFSLGKSQDKEVRLLASEGAYVQSEFNELGDEERVRLTRGAIVDFALVSGLWAWDEKGYEEAHLEAMICTIRWVFLLLQT